MKRNIDVAILLLAAIVFAYFGLWNTFFQQDEWASLGFVQANGIWGNIGSYSVIELLSGKERILGSILNNLFHYFAPLHPVIFSYFAITLHWVNAMLVYLLFVRMTKAKWASLFGAVFFAVCAQASQAVSWISANTTTLPNAFFVLLSLHFLLLAVERKQKKLIAWSFVFAYISFLFKESSLFLIIFLPLFYQMKSKASLKELVKVFWLLGVLLVITSVVRLTILGGAEGQGGIYVTRGNDTAERMIFHALLYPAIGMSQVFIPKEILFPMIERMPTVAYGFLAGNPLRQIIGLIPVGDILSLFASLLLVLGIGSIFIKYKDQRTNIWFSLLFMVLGFLPFIVLDRPASTYLESRYYYLPAIGAGLLFALGISSFGRMAQSEKNGILSLTFSICLVLVSVGYLYKNAVYIRRAVRLDTLIASERKDFLKQMDMLVPTVADKPIFLLTGDSPGYYGISDLSVPFQQGMGYTIMVWFYKSGKIPPDLLSSMFLWNINAQGYKETSFGGFGYFWDEKAFAEFRKNTPEIVDEQVIRLRYKSGEKKLFDENVY